LPLTATNESASAQGLLSAPAISTIIERMKTSAVTFLLWLLSSAVFLGQGTEPPMPKPGLYRGTMTISSPLYGTEDAPIKKVIKVVARVKPYSGNDVRAVIRAEPQIRLLNPVRNFVLQPDDESPGYDLLEQQDDGSTIGVRVNLTPRRDGMTIEHTRQQLSEFGSVASEYIVRFVLRRVGP
jgi:hypothetical protein